MKKILRMSTMFALLVCICLGFAACKPEFTKVHVDLDSIKTIYYVGEAQETYENAKVYAIYENGDQKPIDNEDVTFSTISTAEVGTQTLTVTYKGKSQEITITIREKRVTALDVTGLKTSYVVGEAQDNTCTITATYEDNSTENVNLTNVTFSTISTEEISTTQKITVTYKGFSKEIPVNIAAKPVEGISFVEGSIKTTYYQKDAYQGLNGAQFMLVYEDQSTEPIDFDDLVFTNHTNVNTDTIQTYTINVSYLSYNTTITINVIERVVESVDIIETGLTTKYVVGDTLQNYDNLQVKINYTNETNETVLVSSLADAILTEPTITTAGSTALTLTYKGQTDSVNITVVAVSTIDIDETDLDKNLFVGDDVTSLYNDINITITYSDSSFETKLASEVGASVTKPSTAEVGTSNLTVSYRDVSDSVSITIDELVVKTISMQVADTEYFKGTDTELDKEGISLLVTFTNDKQETLTGLNASTRDIELVGVDLTQSGYQYLTAQCGEVESNQVEITVYSSIYDTYYISEYSAPSFVVKYRENIKANTNEELDYFTKDAGYVVGDDNPFKFLPNITAYAPDANESTTISQYKSLVEVWEWVWNDAEKKTGDFVKLTGDISSKVIIDDENSTLDFTEASVGKTYRISVLPYFDRELPAITFEFTVQDGWNVYDAKELSLMDNMNLTETDPTAIDYKRLKDGIWTAFKEENGLSGIEVNGLFLHSDLTITADDVSSLFFYHPGDDDYPPNSDAAHKANDGVTPLVNINGSLRDYSNIYKRKLTAQPFTFNGNYFNINTDSFPLISVYKGEGISNGITHSSLFWTEGNGTVNFSNVTFFGNAQRTEGIEHSGGLILFKLSDRTTANIDNTIAKAFCITYFPEYGTNMSIKNCKSRDNFSTFIWSYGETHCNITNSEFVNCGGPIAILAHYDPDKSSDQFGNFVVDSDSKLENFVTTQEAWFTLTNSAGMITELAGLEKVINTCSQWLTGTTKSFITTNEKGHEVINFVALIMHCEGPKSSSSNQIQGTFAFVDDDADDNYYSGINMTTDPSTADPAYQKILNISSLVPILQAGGKTIFIDDKYNLLTIDENTGLPRGLTTSEAAFFADNYIGVSVPLGDGAGRTGILFGVFEKETSES